MQFVLEYDLCRLATGCDSHPGNANRLTVALVRFLQRVFAAHFYGYAGRSRIAFEWSVGTVELGSIGLARWVGHGQLIAIHFIGPGQDVPGAVRFFGAPRTRNRMGSCGSLGDTLGCVAAGLRSAARLAAVGPIAGQGVSIF